MWYQPELRLQAHPALATAVEGWIVDAVSGTGVETMPDCHLMTWAECVAALRAAGFHGWIYAEEGDAAPTSADEGLVEATDPAEGIEAKAANDVFVSVYQTVDDATAPTPWPPPSPPGSGSDGGGGTTTGTTFDCPNVNIGTIDFTPLEGLDFGNSFPFGAALWAKNGVSGWDTGATDAPSFTVPLLGSGSGHPVPVDLSILNGFMVVFREFVLMACTFGLIWFLATAAFGFKEWGANEQGTLF
jgi:hypothetical protein